MFEASCHCGDIILKTERPPETVTSCNCSICHRLGALWGYYLQEKVEFAKFTEQHKYSWGKQSITYHSCKRCGCTTHYTSTREDGSYRIAINTRMAARSATENIRVRHFDGADSWKYLDE